MQSFYDGIGGRYGCRPTSEDDKSAQRVPDDYPTVGGAETCPVTAVDPRFQNTNATRYCYVHYADFHRCQFLLGEDESCNIFKTMYQRMCPNEWIDKWDRQRESGTFPKSCTTETD